MASLSRYPKCSNPFQVLSRGSSVPNALWSWLFFGRRTGLGATIDVICLLGMIAVTMVAFWKRDPVVGALFVPYLIWVGFASALTVSVWRRNPTLL